MLGATTHRVYTMPAIVPTQSMESPNITAWVPSPLYRWSLEQYEAMVESGAFSAHDRFHRRSPGPGDIGLIVEVADSSLSEDRKQALIYAQSGVTVYWIVNLVDRVVEVRIKPTPDGYASCLNYMAGENVPVVIDGVEVGQIAVADILP